MKKLYNRIFNKWTKWQLISANEIRYLEVTNPILGVVQSGNVLVDKYMKTNKYTGNVKVKFVEI